MQTWDVIGARRNVRQYTDQPIPREDLERILEAGRRSPSSSNWQPWHFVVVTDREQLLELAEAGPPGGTHIARSAATIALVAEDPPDEQVRQRIAYDFGQATAFMMLTATDLGIGYPADRPLRPVQNPDPVLRRRRALGPLVALRSALHR